MAEELVGIALFGWAPFLCVVVGVSYFFFSSSSTAPSVQRVLTASYAPAAALIYLAAGFSTLAFRQSYLAPVYPALWLAPLGLFVLSLLRFPGPLWAHLVLVPIAVPSIAWQGVWSYWGVYGK